MAVSLAKCQKILRNQPDLKKRRAVIYDWIKTDRINFGQFIELLNYLEHIEDILDAEYTAARLKEIKEKRNGESLETPQVL